MCQALGHPEWATDERYLSYTRRVQNREPLLAQIETMIQTDTVQNWETLLVAAGVAVAPVNRMDQVFRDPQVIASQQVVTIPHPGLGEVKMVSPAVTYSLTPAQVVTPPPGLGEQTAEIIRALSERHPNRAEGLSVRKIADLLGYNNHLALNTYITKRQLRGQGS